MPRIDFRPTKMYVCPTCHHRLVVRPCPRCVVRRRIGDGLSSDALLTAAVERSRRAVADARREGANA
jgi:hypothetical protein